MTKPKLKIVWHSVDERSPERDGTVYLGFEPVARLQWERGLFWNAYVQGAAPIRGLVNDASTKFYVRLALKKQGKV